MSTYRDLHDEMDPPFESFSNDLLGEEFPRELETVSRLWFACGYRPGIGAYLNFFLLRDFIETHDDAFPARFRSLRSMADSFYETDLFIRDVTDSGRAPTGGISSPRVRETLKSIMKRHQALSIPPWMMTYFGFSLLENVEKACPDMSGEENQLHLSYMAKTYRIMGIPFTARRDLMERYGRAVEEALSGASSQLEKHARHILLLGEMVGVSSSYEAIAAMLPERTLAVFADIYPRVRPRALRRVGARLLGRLLMRQAVGALRRAVPASDHSSSNASPARQS